VAASSLVVTVVPVEELADGIDDVIEEGVVVTLKKRDLLLCLTICNLFYVISFITRKTPVYLFIVCQVNLIVNLTDD